MRNALVTEVDAPCDEVTAVQSKPIIRTIRGPGTGQVSGVPARKCRNVAVGFGVFHGCKGTFPTDSYELAQVGKFIALFSGFLRVILQKPLVLRKWKPLSGDVVETYPPP